MWSKPELPAELFQITRDIYLYVYVGAHLSLHIHLHIHHTCTDSFLWVRKLQWIVLIKCLLQLHPFLIREGKEAEKGGYVCLVPLTYFCADLTTAETHHKLLCLWGGPRHFKANTVSHKDLEGMHCCRHLLVL